MFITEEIHCKFLNGSIVLIDNGIPVLADKFLDIQRQPHKSCQRDYPKEMI